MSEVYRPLFLNRAPILFTSRRSAEIIKCAANAFLATKITFINEIADLCEKVDGDVQDVARAMGLDNLVGAKFLHAGPGSGGDAHDDQVALLGLTFKPNTDDKRDSPAIAISQALQDASASVVAFDPEGMDMAAAPMPGVEMVSGPYEAVSGADAMVLVTAWDEFRAIDLARIGGLLRTPVIVDLRNVYRPDEVRAAGFSYVSVGQA